MKDREKVKQAIQVLVNAKLLLPSDGLLFMNTYDKGIANNPENDTVIMDANTKMV